MTEAEGGEGALAKAPVMVKEALTGVPAVGMRTTNFFPAMWRKATWTVGDTERGMGWARVPLVGAGLAGRLLVGAGLAGRLRRRVHDSVT